MILFSKICIMHFTDPQKAVFRFVFRCMHKYKKKYLLENVIRANKLKNLNEYILKNFSSHHNFLIFDYSNAHDKNVCILYNLFK